MNAGTAVDRCFAISAINGAFVPRVDRSLTQLVQPQLTTKQVAIAWPTL